MFNMVAFFNVVAQCWNYAVMKGHVFGKLGAVNNFCRLPYLVQAAARRMCGTMTSAYFDDNAKVDP